MKNGFVRRPSQVRIKKILNITRCYTSILKFGSYIISANSRWFPFTTKTIRQYLQCSHGHVIETHDNASGCKYLPL